MLCCLTPFTLNHTRLTMQCAWHAQAPLVCTWGNRPPPCAGYLMALFPKSKAEELMQLIGHAKEQEVRYRV